MPGNSGGLDLNALKRKLASGQTLYFALDSLFLKTKFILRSVNMMGPTHIAFSSLATVALVKVSGLPFEPIHTLAVLLGSLAPDIDSGSGLIARPGSLFRRFVPKLLVVVLDGVGTMISRGIRSALGHRGPFHYPLLALFMIGGAVFFKSLFFFWFSWAYLWHIIGDFCTVGGVPVLGPFISKSIRWSPLRTGSWQESLLAVFLWGVVAWQGFDVLPEETRHSLESFAQFLRLF